MVFTADGKMTREPVGKPAAHKAEGTWKLSNDGFCTTWKGSKRQLLRSLTAGDNKWSVMKGTTVDRDLDEVGRPGCVASRVRQA